MMWIGQVARMINALLADIAYFSATTLFLGALESRKPHPAQALWVQSLLRELGISIPQAPIFWCDNIGATYLMANPLFHYHFVHDQGSPQSLSVRFISSKDQLTDTFTKPLPTTKFTSLRDNLHVRDLLLMLRGHIETALNTQDNDPPDPIRSRNKCSKIIEVVDEQPSKIMEATSETLEDKNKNN